MPSFAGVLQPLPGTRSWEFGSTRFAQSWVTSSAATCAARMRPWPCRHHEERRGEPAARAAANERGHRVSRGTPRMTHLPQTLPTRAATTGHIGFTLFAESAQTKDVERRAQICIGSRFANETPRIPNRRPAPPLAETWRRSFVELLGTFALVFVGVGTIMAVGPQADAGTLEVALALGLAIACMVSAVGHISGGHFNPAVTFGFMLTRRISLLLGLAYWVAQLAGGRPGSTPAALDLPRRSPGCDEPRRTRDQSTRSTLVLRWFSRRYSRSSSCGSSLRRLPIRAAHTAQSQALRSASRSSSACW